MTRTPAEWALHVVALALGLTAALLTGEWWPVVVFCVTVAVIYGWRKLRRTRNDRAGN